MTRTPDEAEPIVDAIEEVHRTTGAPVYRVFRDWITMVECAFRRDDPEYLDTLDRYEDLSGDKEWVAERFAEGFGDLQVGMIETQRELLGDVYEALGMQSDDFGQHFTPWNVCVAISHMSNAATDLEDSPVQIGDPACGSGRMLISTAMDYEDQVDVQDARGQLILCGKDKDRLCAQMTAINLTIARTPGVAVHGDTLAEETHTIWVSQPGSSPPLTTVEPTADNDPFVRDWEAVDDVDGPTPETDGEPQQRLARWS